RGARCGRSLILEMGALEGMDGVETLTVETFARRVRELEDAAPHRANGARLRALAARDGFLFVRGLVPTSLVMALRERVLDYAGRLGWRDPQAPPGGARA